MKKIFTFLVIGLPILIASSTNPPEALSQQRVTKINVLEHVHQHIKLASDMGTTPDIDLVRQALNYTAVPDPLHESAATVLKTVISKPIMPDAIERTLEWFELALSQPRLDQSLRQTAANILAENLTATKNNPNLNILRLALKCKASDPLFNTASSSLVAAINNKPDIELVSLAFEYANSNNELKIVAIKTLENILNQTPTDETPPNPSWVKIAFKNTSIYIGLWQIAVNHVTRVFQMAEETKTPLSPEWCAIGLHYLPRN